MEPLLAEIVQLVGAGSVRLSAHGFEELAADDISFAELLETLPQAVSVEIYPDHHKGPSVLVLQILGDERPVHALWGMAKNAPEIATLITAYRPDPARWSEDFLMRKPK